MLKTLQGTINNTLAYMQTIDKRPIFIVCWKESAESRPAIVNESLAFLSAEQAADYQITLNEDAKNHGWDLDKSGYYVKTMDVNFGWFNTDE